MRRCSREWPFPRRRMIRVQRPHPPMSPRHPVHQSWPRRGEVQSSWGGEKSYIPPNQWWLLERSPNHPGPWGQEEDQFSSPRLDQQSLQPLYWRLTPHPKPSLPVQALAVIRPTTPPCGFAGVTACLWTPEPSGMASEAPHDTLSLGVVATPKNLHHNISHIIRDEAMGVTYMDMVTTSIGRVALSGPDQEASSQGPTIEDVTNHE